MDQDAQSLGLSGKVAAVTGSARGWGRGIAMELAARGVKVIVNGTNAETVRQTCADIRASGGIAEAAVVDLSTPEGPAKVVDAAVEAFGRIDILINNAGRLMPALLVDMTDAQWDAILAVQLTAQFRSSRQAARHMIGQGQGGRIINMVGGGGFTGFHANGNHCASKGGGMGAVLTWAEELRPHGITVNGVAGMVETDLVRPLQDKVRAALLEAGQPHSITAREMGSYPPEEAAALVVWLASQDASDVSGQFFETRGPVINLWKMACVDETWTREPRWTPEDIVRAKVARIAAGPSRIEPTHVRNAVVSLRAQ